MVAMMNLTIDVTENVTVTGNCQSLTLSCSGYYNNTVKVSAV
jgi:hypothetical protein